MQHQSTRCAIPAAITDAKDDMRLASLVEHRPNALVVKWPAAFVNVPGSL
jgi:hypothetical protein